MIPVTVIKEDGTAKADANSYAAVADGDWYHQGRLYASAWLAADDNQKGAALVMATRLIDAEYQFGGVRTLPMQALQWPRMDCREPDGNTAQFVSGGGVAVVPRFVIPGGAGRIILVDNPMLVPGNVVPKAIVEATCELARELIVADRTAAPAGEGLKYENNGSVQKGYDKADTRPVIPKLVQAMLAKYGSLISAKSGSVNLVRT